MELHSQLSHHQKELCHQTQCMQVVKQMNVWMGSLQSDVMLSHQAHGFGLLIADCVFAVPAGVRQSVGSASGLL